MPNSEINKGLANLFKKERWIKLYRKLHNMFLAEEFVHKQDLELYLKTLEAKLDAMETAYTSGIAANAATTKAMSSVINSHTHMVPQAPAGVTTSSPPASPTVSVEPQVPKSPKIKLQHTTMKAVDNMYKSLGPVMAPVATGVTPSEIAATVQMTMDIGL